MTTQTENQAVAEQQPRPAMAPRYGIAEEENAYVVTAYVPGVAASNVETIIDGEKLVVNARRNWTMPEGWTPVHREIAQADYRLVLGLDRRVNRDGVKAQLTQGVLTLTLPKAEELKPRKIEIAG
jgi:HSP20 family molecular chaperone IbpA